MPKRLKLPTVTPSHIYPLTEFVRNPAAHIATLRQTMAPSVLTVRGKARIVMVDPGTWEYLIARLERAEKTYASEADVLNGISTESIEELASGLRDAFGL